MRVTGESGGDISRQIVQAEYQFQHAKLTGVIFLHDIKAFLNERELQDLVIARDLGHPLLLSARPGDTLAECLRTLSATELDHLPVIDSDSERRLVGVVTR